MAIAVKRGFGGGGNEKTVVLYDHGTQYLAWDNGIYKRESSYTVAGGVTFNSDNIALSYSGLSSGRCRSALSSVLVDFTDYTTLNFDTSNGLVQIDVTDVTKGYIFLGAINSPNGYSVTEMGVSGQKANYASYIINSAYNGWTNKEGVIYKIWLSGKQTMSPNKIVTSAGQVNPKYTVSGLIDVNTVGYIVPYRTSSSANGGYINGVDFDSINFLTVVCRNNSSYANVKLRVTIDGNSWDSAESAQTKQTMNIDVSQVSGVHSIQLSIVNNNDSANVYSITGSYVQ